MNHIQACLLRNGFPDSVLKQTEDCPAEARQELTSTREEDNDEEAASQQLILEVVHKSKHIVEQLLVSIIVFHLRHLPRDGSNMLSTLVLLFSVERCS